MITQRVLTRSDLVEILRMHHCEQTGEGTATGEFWKAPTGRHFLVPNCKDGYYSDWMLYDLEEIVGRLELRSARLKN
jgi:hypothetical protein